MELTSPATALSPAVKHLIGCVGCRDENRQEVESETSSSLDAFLTSAGDLDVDQLASLLPSQDNSVEYFERAVDVLAPVFARSQRVLFSLGDEHIHTKLLPTLQWTQSEKIWSDCLSMLKGQQKDSNDILVLLLLTASLERALGNIYLLQGSQCPSMLKDLLATEELTNTLGHSVMQLLRILIGPPTSLNLRNVAWHGFLGDGELPLRYNCFLVLLSASIGKMLTEKGISAVPHRPFFTWTSTVKNRLLSSLQLVDSSHCRLDLQSLVPLLKACVMIQPQTESQWQQAFSLYEQGSYGYCLALLLPLLEHCLRRVFAAVNNCPHRVLTAESSAFYTTFNEMLEQNLPDGATNQLPAFLTTPCMDLLQDLLFYPEGPRARDHLSHGEVDFGAVDQDIVYPFLCAIIFIAHRLCAGSSLSMGDTDFKEVVEKIQCYKSVFHPVAILQQKFAGLLGQLEKTEASVLVSANLELLGDGAGPPTLCENNAMLIRTQGEMLPLWQSEDWIRVCPLLLTDLSNGFSMRLDSLKRLSQEHIPTLFRWQFGGDPGQVSGMRESEFVGLLLRITEECSTAIEQIQQTVQQRQQQLLAKELRSRQRENLKKLLRCIPCLQMLVAAVSAAVGWNIQRLHDFSSLTPRHCNLMQKHLKWTLQQCENLRTFTASDRNKWTESVDLLLCWLPRCQQFAVQWSQLPH